MLRDCCSGPGPLWRFEAQSFATVCGPSWRRAPAAGAACDVCCELTLANDRVRLLLIDLDWRRSWQRERQGDLHQLDTETASLPLAHQSDRIRG